MQEKLSLLSGRYYSDNWNGARGGTRVTRRALFQLRTSLCHDLFCILFYIYHRDIDRYDICYNRKQKDVVECPKCDYNGIKLVDVHRVMKWCETILLFLWHLLFYAFSVAVFIVLVTPIIYYTYIYVENEWKRVSHMFVWYRGKNTFGDYML